MTSEQIDLNDETSEVSDTIMKLVADVLTTAIKEENVDDDAEVSVTFVNNDKIQSINKEFRGIDKPTDVLSFALNEGEPEQELLEEGIPNLLGDIIISVPRAIEQAEEYGHSPEREYSFLAVHGFLHLLGYDHDTEEHEKNMFRRQEEILEKHGLKK